MSADLLTHLNAPQRQAVMTVDGPVLVLAGAGSGKTRVITHRLAYLVQAHGVWASKILAVTFTNKAAGEMRTRVAQLIGEAEAARAWVGTFHATCVRLLRRDADAFQVQRNFVIYDAADQLRLVKQALKALHINDKQVHPNAALNEISRAKNRLEAPEVYAETAAGYFEGFVVDIYTRYQAALDANNALDFDDLIRRVVDGLRGQPALLAKYQQQFAYVMVDEYQDTNHAQYQLVRLLTQAQPNLCVVGDDDQSIYGWRGADVRNILDFESDYPNTTVITLEENYRSTQNILSAANVVVANNATRRPKTLWTSRPAGELLTIVALADEQDEAAWIIDRLQELRLSEDSPLKAFAIFYRTNAQSRVLEDALRRADLPYVLIGGTRFYDRREVKDIIAYLRLVANPADDLSALRIVNVPTRGIGKTTVGRVQGWATAQGLSFLEALRGAGDVPGLGAGARKRVRAFVELYDAFVAASRTMEVPAFVEHILAVTGYVETLERAGTGEALDRLQNLEELVSAAAEFVERADEVSLDAFLQGVALLSQVDALDDSAGAVTLMTLHSAKGLEFPVVFMAGMEEGLFPHNNALYGERDIEEERRLCYVGLTRAKDRLILTHAWQRRIYGSAEMQAPSRFLDELPREVVQFEGVEQAQWQPDAHASLAGHAGVGGGFGAPAGAPATVRTADGYTLEYDEAEVAFGGADPRSFHVGEVISHATWGRGRIIETQGKGARQKIEVMFGGEVGVRILRVKDAPIERLIQ